MIIVYLFKYFFAFLYFFIKLFKVEDKIVLISRFYKKTSVDFELLEKELLKEYKKVIILNHKTKNPFKLFYFSLIQTYHLGTSKAAIIDSYIPIVSMLKHREQLIIIQIWHSSGAIKKFGYDSLDKEGGRSKKVAKAIDMHKNYDYVICAGPASIQHMSKAFGTDENKAKPYGLPRMSLLMDEAQLKKEKENLRKKYNLRDKKTIIYAPTFRKNNNIQYDALINEIDFEKYNLIIKKHPNDKSLITGNENIIIEKEVSIFKLFSVADYVITDYSAISIDASILNIPVFFFLYDIEEYTTERGLNIDFEKDYSEITFYNSKDIKDLINKKYSFESLKKFNENFVSKDYMNSTKNIINLIKETK